MFRTSLKARSYRQNLRLAVFLPGTAGLVNSIGLLQSGVFTTNITGHFALLSESLVLPARQRPSTYCIYILSFFFGGLLSGWLNGRDSPDRNTLHPNAGIIIEIMILIAVGLTGSVWTDAGLDPMVPAACLLFAMGLQNGLVSIISKTTVRTTHLTGVLTDLGTDLAHLHFEKSHRERAHLIENIHSRLVNIIFFTAGCLLGAAMTPVFHFHGLLFGALVLLMAMHYHHFRIGVYRLRKRYFLLLH